MTPAQIVTALRVRAAHLLDEADRVARHGEIPVGPENPYPRPAGTLALIAHEFLNIADQVEATEIAELAARDQADEELRQQTIRWLRGQ